MRGLVANLVGVAGGVVAIELISKFQSQMHFAENDYSRWPRRAAAVLVAVGGFAVSSKAAKGSFAGEAAEGLAMSGVTQFVQQMWGQYVA